jgi:hypothetical protein
MALPYTFIAGDVARSVEVNANFNYIMNVIGDLVGPDRISTLKDFVMGVNSNTLLTAASQHLFQIGWNANWTHIGGGVFQWTRLVALKPASVMRVGKDGFETMYTAETEGDLGTQIKTNFAVRGTYAFLDPSLTIYNKDATNQTLDKARLTFTPFWPPKAVFSEAGPLVAKNSTYTGSTYKVPSNAKGIKLMVRFKAGANDVELRFFPTGVDRTIPNSVVVAGPSGKVSSGNVDLFFGAGNSNFIIEQLAPLDKLTITIQGYWS